MTPLKRIIEPSTSDAHRSRIHYEALHGRASLCEHVRVYKSIDGERMRVWYHTKREVTCKNCVSRFRTMITRQLSALGGEQLEDIAAHIETFTAKYPPARPGAAPDGTR
jgi:hypothetical protein